MVSEHRYICAVVEAKPGRFEVTALGEVRTAEENAARYPEGLKPSVVPSGRYAAYAHLRVKGGEGIPTGEEFMQGIAAVVEGIVRDKSPEPAALAEIALGLTAQNRGYSVSMHTASHPATSSRVTPVGTEDPTEAGDSLTGMANFVFGSLGGQPRHRQER